jgi:hypothetical protein
MMSPLRQRSIILLGILAAVSVGVYLLASSIFYRIGFPLDDAWIHQTYARNLVQYGQWAFVPGAASAGSTAPLWSGLLALGHLLGLGPYLWTYVLGWLLLWLLATLGMMACGYLCPQKPKWAFWVGVLMTVEWHMVWSAGSGMETLLMAVLALLIFVWLLGKWQYWWALGLLIGVIVWVRPDGITLLGPTSLAIALMPGLSMRRRSKAFAFLALGLVVPLGSYLIFNHVITGNWWPNTLYAKQAEYAILRQQPFLHRFLSQLAVPVVGMVGAPLLLGYITWTQQVWREHAWLKLVGLLWALGYAGLYAWRLPVTYQYGRYVMPMLPVLYLPGLVGLALWTQPGSSIWWRRLLSKVWLGVTVVVTLVSWFTGAIRYARDVAIIESEMVATAHWVAENVPDGAVVAAHDIGALGYFGHIDRWHLIDLAGLVSPDVIPIIRDEDALALFLDAQETTYLVTFPGWYRDLPLRAQEIYVTGGRFSPPIGGENMTVYLWQSP